VSLSPVCYPQPGKARSREVLEAFATGCGGKIAQSLELEEGPAAFYGTIGLEALVRRAMAEGRAYLGDNSFFDCGRGKFFRFAKNAFQISSLAPPDYARFKSLGLVVKPWQRGEHIVIVEQSAHFLNLVGASNWLARTLAELKACTDRPLKVRLWNRDKGGAAKSLQADLEGAHALVTCMSAAANEALLAGVPVFVTGPCAATPMASGPLSEIERPRYPDGREDWAAGLAGRQWVLEEFRSGLAWRQLTT
jgi:hypothetical protein